jgi:hypothetical protein
VCSIYNVELINLKIITIILLSLLIISCADNAPKELQEKILVNIADQATISVNEFLRRAEYVPRPDYCKANTYLHKKIILNSLIAEKILALEARKDSILKDNIEFELFVKGHKEQAMRQYMHHIEATKKVVMEEKEIIDAYKYAGREYQINYFTLDDSSDAKKVQRELKKNPKLFNEIYSRTTEDKSTVPKRNVKWNSNEPIMMFNALFLDDLKKDQVLEPIKVNEKNFVFIKILSWTNDLAITEKQIQERQNVVTEKLAKIKASDIWDKRVEQIMLNKRMDFNKDVFYKLSDLLYEVYFPSVEEKRDDAIDKLWRKDEQAPKSIQNMSDEDLLNESFFSVDGKVWTVRDFHTELMSHPLVFRNKHMSSKDFPKEFRFAIADLVRDHSVTQKAYEAGYDNINIVKRNISMWEDTFLALNKKHKYLDSVKEKRSFAENYHKILKETLNPYINELQKKYYKKIKLDFDTFEKITLSSIDLYVKYDDLPYQDVVPLFPVITTDHLIEYVDKM